MVRIENFYRRYNHRANRGKCFHLSWYSIHCRNDNTFCSPKSKIQRMVWKEIHSTNQSNYSNCAAVYNICDVLLEFDLKPFIICSLFNDLHSSWLILIASTIRPLLTLLSVALLFKWVLLNEPPHFLHYLHLGDCLISESQHIFVSIVCLLLLLVGCHIGLGLRHISILMVDSHHSVIEDNDESGGILGGRSLV